MVDSVRPAEARWLNPAALRWAREWRGRTLEEAARKVGKRPEDVLAWESGSKSPTVKQARTLARYYDRSFLEFILRELPPTPGPVALPDFRMHRDVLPPAEDREFQNIQRWVGTQRLNALDLYEEIGETPPEIPPALFAKPGEPPEIVAGRARPVLDFPIERQLMLKLGDTRLLPDILRGIFESVGILTLKRTDLAKFGVRGICLAEFPLPTIVITKESPAAQPFTLAHELGHVVRRSSAISGLREQGPNHREVERWCNQFAGAFLMPAPVVALAAGSAPAQPAPAISDRKLGEYARSLRVSPHAMLIRLVDLGYVHPDFYREVKQPDFLAREESYRGGGRSEYYGSRYRSTQGDLYTGLVLEAWGLGRITGHNAAEFMGIRNLNHLYGIRDRFSQP